jgi:tetratricopeptide (TPR) repeat protein
VIIAAHAILPLPSTQMLGEPMDAGRDKSLLIVNIDQEGNVLLEVRLGEEPERRRQIPAGTFISPLGLEQISHIRWYLEDYLQTPFGIYDQRASEASALLMDWGEQVFSALFGSGPGAEAYTLTTAGGHSNLEVCIQSDSPRWLAFPWELMKDPSRSRPLTLELAGLTRGLPNVTKPRGPLLKLPGNRVRVLLVIARPAGQADVSYRTIARQLVERLQDAPNHIELVVLRPPTFDALRRMLKDAQAADDPFHVVHFDGHGALMPPTAGATQDDEGAVLAFELPSGGQDLVAAPTVARLMREAQIWLVVLNACQSGAVGRHVDTSMATRLLAEGVASVVAMSYVVYVSTAAAFLGVFYERLFRGASVTEAVTAGRISLRASPNRPSPKGPTALEDWIVPVQYIRRDVAMPQLASADVTPGDGISTKHYRHIPDDRGTRAEAEANGEAFFGRDGAFYELDAAFTRARVVLIWGMAGIGKTALAQAYGRWCVRTGSVDSVTAVSLSTSRLGSPDAQAALLLKELARRVIGGEADAMNEQDRDVRLRRALAERRHIVIVDGLELAAPTTNSASKITPPHLAPAPILRVIETALTGLSSVLLTSRTIEPSLGRTVHRLRLQGLEPSEAIEYVDALLGAAPHTMDERVDRAFGELLQLVDGHPLALESLVPQLQFASARELLSGISGYDVTHQTDVSVSVEDLTASVHESYIRLSERSRKLLPALSLLYGATGIAMLSVFSDIATTTRFAGVEMQDWHAMLVEAASVGLAAEFEPDPYHCSLHPGLGPYFASFWATEDPDWSHRDAAIAAFSEVLAQLCGWALHEASPASSQVLRLHESNLRGFLSLSLARGAWDVAATLLERFSNWLDMQGRWQEGRALCIGAQAMVESHENWVGTPSMRVWLIAEHAEGGRNGQLHSFEASSQRFQAMLDLIGAQPDPAEWSEYRAVAEYGLGNTAIMSGDLDAASRRLHASHISFTEVDDADGVANSAHALGTVAQARQDFEEAKRWYLKSLDARGRSGNEPRAASTYLHLGVCTQAENEFSEAETWYRKALDVFSQSGDLYAAAKAYHNLGSVAHAQGQLDLASEWARAELRLVASIGDDAGEASACSLLSQVEAAAGNFAEATEWAERSYEIGHRLGDRELVSVACNQLGLLAWSDGRLDEALRYTVVSVGIWDYCPHPLSQGSPRLLAFLTAKLGIQILEHQWQEQYAVALPDDVRTFVISQPPVSIPEPSRRQS